MKPYGFSSLLAVFIATLISVVMAYFDYRNNPGGVFYSRNSGPNWTNIIETFLSWFLPLCLLLCAVFVVFVFIQRAIAKALKN